VTFETQMWRAQDVYRGLALLYAVLLYADEWDTYTHPALGWFALAVMIAWSAFTALAYQRPRGRSWPVLAADLALGSSLIVASRYLNDIDQVESGAHTLPSIWVSAAVLAWAIKGGPFAGIAAGAVLGGADILERGTATADTVHNIVLLVLAGIVVGYVAMLGRQSEAALARASRIEAATRERERLARNIHDSVLQVLALVQRRGGEIGGEAVELGRLAGEQEVALRALVATDRDRERWGWLDDNKRAGPAADLRSLLRGVESTNVTVSAPGTPVMLPARAAHEVVAAVQAALDNVRNHVGDEARAWVLLEEEPDCVVVTVRDDGPGIPAGRLDAAAAEGRLGVSQSIQGRLRDLGGTATLTSAPGEGTEVELRVPRTKQ
jgi:signal transduction histidine kinase